MAIDRYEEIYWTKIDRLIDKLNESEQQQQQQQQHVQP